MVAILSVVIASLSVAVAAASIWVQQGIRESIDEGNALAARSQIPTISMGVRRNDTPFDSDLPYNREVSARPGEIISASFVVRNTHNEPMDMNVRVNLPVAVEGISIIEGSVTVHSRQFPDGQPISGNLTQQISLGMFNPFDAERGIGWAEVRFQIQVDENVAEHGLIRSSFEIGSQTTGYDRNGIIVTDTHRAFAYINIIND
jgi:hypothetical protein